MNDYIPQKTLVSVCCIWWFSVYMNTHQLTQFYTELCKCLICRVDMSYIFETQCSPFSKQAVGIWNVGSAHDGSHLLYHIDDLPEVLYGFWYLLFWYSISNNPLSQRGWPKWPKFDTQLLDIFSLAEILYFGLSSLNLFLMFWRSDNICNRNKYEHSKLLTIMKHDIWYYDLPEIL